MIHKYDPISQENYYQLFSFFNSTEERGDAIFSENAVEYGQEVSNLNSMNAGPVLALPSEEVKKVRNSLLRQIEQKQTAIEEMEQSNRAAFQSWLSKQNQANVLDRVVKKNTLSHLTFDDMANGKARDNVPGVPKASYYGNISAVPGKIGKAVRSDASGQFVADGSRTAFERMEPFTISFWIQRPKDFEEAHVLYNGNNRIQGYRGWDIMLDTNRIHFRLNHAHPYQSLDIRLPEELPLNEWVHFVWTYDGSSRAEGMKLYKNGEKVQADIRRNHLYRSTKPYMTFPPTVYMAYKGIIIGNRHYDQDFTGGLLDEIQILQQEADDYVAKNLYNKASGRLAFNRALKEKSNSLDEFYDLFIDQDLDKAREQLQEIQAREILTIDTVQEIMVMGDQTEARATFVLDSGVYDAHGKSVKRDVPEDIFPWPEELSKNRFGLGQWLIHPDHPLTARVAVNQIWYLMFGRGIVETVEDFGNQGALPSHPELLDYLAVDFQENGWDTKALIRKIVLSST